MNQVYALVDGNSFFASCERVFRPDLRYRPIIVLSNNDGCVVARSKEAKKLGIKMGQPFFQIEEFCIQNKVSVFSSNYELYGDLSGRMMTAIASLSAGLEVYSIDEAFANFSGLQEAGVNLTNLGFQIKNRVMQWVGIPTCVGIAPTKTLAKYCNHLAKKYPGLKGVCNWLPLNSNQRKKALACQPISEVWGVGRRYEKRLNALGIETVLQLAQADPATIENQFNIVLARTVRELRGENCIDFEELHPKRKQILRSRSFGAMVGSKEELAGAICFHAEEAVRTVRREGSCAHVVGIVLNTNRFRKQDPQYHVYPAIGLERGADDPTTIIQAAMYLLNQYYRPGYAYKRAGVYLSELSPKKLEPLDLFVEERWERNELLANTVDRINAHFGKYTVVHAASLLHKEAWQMKRDRVSPQYTTCFADLPRVS
ncbi:MAG: Y-family DNA polymerase [Burkholderiales bacterium]|nr:Y-family DNA polymerase [Burkholderiales bacterium]